MTTRPTERLTAMESVVRVLEEAIVSNGLEPGTRLPSEESLALQYGVSRPVIREALGQLRERGFVKTYNGKGTYVHHPDGDTISRAIERHLYFADASHITVDHLYQAREAIEVCSARLAAENSTEDDRAHLAENLTVMRSDRHDRDEYAAADVAFHVAVARASGNPLLPILLGPLVQTILRGIRESHSTREGVDLGLRGHAQILKYISMGDAASAASAMTLHLTDSHRLFPKEVLHQQG